MKTEHKLYELTLSQELSKLQTKYTLYKRVINIVMSATSDDKIDYDTMLKAFNMAVERNDCTRIRFVKSKGKLMQYILPHYEYDKIVEKSFETKQAQDKFIEYQTHHAIKYMKGEVVTPFLIHTYDGKDMILLKVCHMCFDLYGLNIFFNDLFGVYDALRRGDQLPKCPTPFLDIIEKEVVHKFDKEYDEKNRQFFTEYLGAKQEPAYAGLNGKKGKLYDKMIKKNVRTMNLFFINNDTEGFMHEIPQDVSSSLLEYCKQNKVSPANFLFFAFNVVQARLNDVYHLMPLELCNCRGTMADKLSAGTKVQSLACYTEVVPDLEFEQNLKQFCQNQSLLYRHIGFSDTEFQMLSHKLYKSSLFRTYYSLTFSFVPMLSPKGIEFMIHSNGKCALPAYIAVLYDVNTERMQIAYDVQTKLMDGNDVENFHKLLISTIRTVLAKPNTKICDLKID